MFSSNATQVSSANYIEEVFSTYLYTGTGASQTITNGIDLSTKGGLVWFKYRDVAYVHRLFDTERGANKVIFSNLTNAQSTITNQLTSFNNNGFSLGNDATAGGVNDSGGTFASWTFRKQAKFFDVVTYTGTGSLRTVSHSLGSVPGCIIIKNLSDTDGWLVYHRSIGATKTLSLNTTGAAVTDGNTYFNDTEPTSTQFTVNIGGKGNQSGNNYVAYLFAHDAGGFGLTGTDNVISCGSFTTDASGNFSVNLGYEPQWVMIKSTNNTGVSAAQQNWIMMDNMRGFVTQSGTGARLRANTSEAESTTNDFGPTATGFESLGNMSASAPFIYIAIRRGPMKVPTDATKVFYPTYGTGGTPGYPSSFTVDGLLNFYLSGTTGNPNLSNRLVGTNYIATSSTAAEVNGSPYWKWDFQTGTGTSVFTSAFVGALLKRAPNFFDVVCYTGNGSSNNAKTHNLGVAPELLIIKNRSSSGSGDWYTFHTFTSSNFKKQLLDTTDAQTNYTYGSFLDAQPTSTTFTVNSGAGCNESGVTYVAYLFATCAGVSKVGSYTGTGALQTVNCGFTSGARFVLVKRTDSTGDWYVWDSARGITSGNDPYYLLNSTAAQVTGTNYVDTDSTGFKVTAAAPAELNASGGTYIFLAIA